MKKFLIQILSFFILVLFVDTIFGISCTYLNSHAKGGDTKSHYYIANESSEDVVVLGSSRAIHHYVSKILSDSLQMSVYNCGKDGNGIVLMYGRLKMMMERYTPKLVIYDVTASFDIEENDNHKYLDWIKSFHDKPGIDEIFDIVDYKENVLLMSNMYKYNSAFVQMLSDNIRPMQEVSEGGYKPLFDVMTYTPTTNNYDLHIKKWDPVKKTFFIKLVELCKQKNICLVVNISPYYDSLPIGDYLFIKEMCNDFSVPLFDHFCESDIIHKKELFADPSHLNHTGALIYTKKIILELKQVLSAHQYNNR